MTADKDILKLWAIKKSDPSIKEDVNNLENSQAIVDTEKEEKRITDNKKNGVNITTRETPGKNMNAKSFSIN